IRSACSSSIPRIGRSPLPPRRNRRIGPLRNGRLAHSGPAGVLEARGGDVVDAGPRGDPPTPRLGNPPGHPRHERQSVRAARWVSPPPPRRPTRPPNPIPPASLTSAVLAAAP